MAIEKHRSKDLLQKIDALFEELTVALPIPKATLLWVKEKILGEALAELRHLVEESRPPTFYLVGRSGHGKSSLINALANQDVAPVGHSVSACTAETKPYQIRFPKQHAEWSVYDSRGIFEIKPPPGASTADPVVIATQDILRYKPDIIIHVISIPEVRACAKDVEVMNRIQTDIQAQRGSKTPVLVVLTKTDTLGSRREWPPDQFPAKAKEIESYVTGMATHGTQAARHQAIVRRALHRGCQILGDSHFLYVVTVNVPRDQEDRWNIELLGDIVGGQLPYAARLQFFQALQRKKFLQEMAAGIVTKFSALAGMIGAAPIPIADIVILTPVQLLMIAIIGGLSCRELSTETATEYTSACGVAVGAGFALRTVAQQLVKLIPFAGVVVSGGIAAAGTYALGKSAEAYFFSGEVRKPEEFKDDYKPNVE